MRLAASETPPLSALSFNGSVHSVFRRVVNVRLGSGELLTLYAGDDKSEPPGAITIAAPAGLDFARHIAHHAAISCRAGVLRIEGSDISLDLRQARRRELTPVATGVSVGFSDAWRVAWQTMFAASKNSGLVVALHGKRAAGSLDTALAERARRTLPRMLNAARSYDFDATLTAAARLIGAGPGLTPSGDDFLAGFLVGMRRAAQQQAKIAFVDRLGRELAILYGDSGDIAHAYLIHAAAGRAARPLVILARSIANGADENATTAATVAAMHVGHSSGSDATFGLISGLAAWREDLAALIASGLGTDGERVAPAPAR